MIKQVFPGFIWSLGFSLKPFLCSCQKEAVSILPAQYEFMEKRSREKTPAGHSGFYRLLSRTRVDIKKRSGAGRAQLLNQLYKSLANSARSVIRL